LRDRHAARQIDRIVTAELGCVISGCATKEARLPSLRKRQTTPAERLKLAQALTATDR
jgi:hypothetical protein